jgi:pyroglutamyl-peptidase
VTLESTARNAVAHDRPDHTGACAPGKCVVEGGPALLPTRLPIEGLAKRLKAADIPVSHSDDAGDYLCNLLFYRLMTLAEAGGPQVAGFIHVPYLDTQVARFSAAGHHVPHASTLSETQLIDAVKIAVDACVEALQQSSRGVA